jgi:hypothetical protein
MREWAGNTLDSRAGQAIESRNERIADEELAETESETTQGVIHIKSERATY